MGCSSLPKRCARSARGKAIANPITTAIAVNSMCCTSAGCSVSPQWAFTQSQQNVWSPVTQALPWPKFGMTTGPPTAAPLRPASRKTPSTVSPSTTTSLLALAPRCIRLTAFRTVVVGRDTGARIARRRRRERDIAEASSAPAGAAPGHSPMNSRDEVVGGVGEDRVRRVVLREHAALAEDRDARRPFGSPRRRRA